MAYMREMQGSKLLLVVPVLMLILFGVLGPVGREVVGTPLALVDAAIGEVINPGRGGTGCGRGVSGRV
jgi:hypothetical protein